MITQRKVTRKTASAVLIYSEMGDIVVNSSSNTTMTLPTPSAGLWYQISNVGSGTVSIFYGTTIASLKQSESALLLANGSSGWYLSKGSVGETYTLTKAAIEAVLTGVISTHSHSINLSFTDLEDAPDAYTGSQNMIVAVNASASGLVFVSAPEAANGVPAGGSTGQLLSKKSTADFDAEWVDAGTPSGAPTESIWGGL